MKKPWISFFLLACCLLNTACTSYHRLPPSQAISGVHPGDDIRLNFRDGTSQRITVYQKDTTGLTATTGKYFSWRDISTVEISTLSPGKSAGAVFLGSVIVYITTVLAFNNELTDAID